MRTWASSEGTFITGNVVSALGAPRGPSGPLRLLLPRRRRAPLFPAQVELQAMINEKKAELERLNLQFDSLQRVEADQKALIERLTNNEA